MIPWQRTWSSFYHRDPPGVFNSHSCALQASIVHIVFILVYLSLLVSCDPLYLLYCLSTFLGSSSWLCDPIFLIDVGGIAFSFFNFLLIAKRRLNI